MKNYSNKLDVLTKASVTKNFKDMVNENKAYFNDKIDINIEYDLEEKLYDIEVVVLSKGYPCKEFSDFIESEKGLEKIIEFMDKNRVKCVSYEKN